MYKLYYIFAQNISKKILGNKLTQELLSNNDYCKEFATSKSIPQLVNEYINLKRYRKDDMDLILHAFCKATKTKVILYEVQRYALRANRYTAGLMETDDEVKLFYNDQHYKPLITLNQSSRPINDTIEHCNSDISTCTTVSSSANFLTVKRSICHNRKQSIFTMIKTFSL